MRPATSCRMSGSARRCWSSGSARPMPTSRSPRSRPCGGPAARSSTCSWPWPTRPTADATRRLEVYADGALVDARELTIPAGQRSEALITTVPAGSRAPSRRAWRAATRWSPTTAPSPSCRPTRRPAPCWSARAIAYLENALALLPRLELYAVDEDGYADALADADEAGTPYGLVIFDGVVPDEAPGPAGAVYRSR